MKENKARAIVISGGPGTGKTAVISELRSKGYKILPEAARSVAQKDQRFKNKNIKEINLRLFQNAIFNFQKEKLSKIKGNKIFFSDRGFGDSLAYYTLNKLKIPKKNLEYAKKVKHDQVFILDFLDFYETDALRTESKEEQVQIHNEIIKTYKKLGYKVSIVPFMSVKERVKFILDNIKIKDPETTFAMMKPDALEKGLDKEIIMRIRKIGLKIEKTEKRILKRKDVEKLYSNAKKNMPHLFDSLVEYITRGEVVLMKVSGLGAIGKIATLRGASNPVNAKKGTIRGDYAKDQDYTKIKDRAVENIFHSPDEIHEAIEMLEHFFGGKK